MLLCFFNLLGLVSTSPSPSVAVFPFETESPLPAETGLGLVIALEDQQEIRSDLVTVEALQAAMTQFGLKVGAPVPFAKKIQVAQALGVDIFFWGRVTPHGIQIDSYDLQASSMGNSETLALSPLESGFLAQFFSALGFSVANPAEAGIDFYTQMAATFLVQDQEFVQKMLTRLVKSQPSSAMAYQLFMQKCLLPEPESLELEELSFWRDLLMANEEFMKAYGYSNQLLDSRFEASDYGAHAHILFALGKEDRACTYAKMAVTYGAAPTSLGPAAQSCGLEWLSTLDNGGTRIAK
ncbi:MAG: hypothetical protein H6510_04075 [Acidobacteria bacterium]|nr:hypothetical protein [Acidobacteriota bacterium]MCB9396973.1 hypothetical protein [Acidobacteriota bacterium]